MKLIISTIVFIVMVCVLHLDSDAQSFTIPNDTITATITTDDQKFYNRISNISTAAITVTWEIIEHDFPLDWQSSLAMCDNKLCYTGGALFDGTAEVTDPISPGTQGEFYVWPVLSSATPGTHYIKVRMKVSLESKDSWYIFTKNATSVITGIEGVNTEIVIFPNPTNNKATILHDKNLNIHNIIVTGLAGNHVKTLITNEEVTHIQLDDLPCGTYILRFTDSNNATVKVARLYRN